MFNSDTKFSCHKLLENFGDLAWNNPNVTYASGKRQHNRIIKLVDRLHYYIYFLPITKEFICLRMSWSPRYILTVQRIYLAFKITRVGGFPTPLKSRSRCIISETKHGRCFNYS
jgi:hypothetical protein